MERLERGADATGTQGRDGSEEPAARNRRRETDGEKPLLRIPPPRSSVSSPTLLRFYHSLYLISSIANFVFFGLFIADVCPTVINKINNKCSSNCNFVLGRAR